MFNVMRGAFALALSAFVISGVDEARSETVWRYSSFVPATHFMNQGAFLPWAEEVSKATNGRVKIELLPKVVGSAQSQYDVVRDELADIAIFVPGYTPGRFDLAGIGELPMLTENPEAAATAFHRLYEKYLAETGLFSEVHVLAAYTVSAGHFFTRDARIDNIDDIKGLKIRAAVPSTVPTLEALGAIPVQKPVTELYELLSTGALDGSVSGLDQVIAFKLADVTKHVTIIPGGLFNSVLVLAVNKSSWDKLSEEDRTAISLISGEVLAKRVGATFHDPIAKGIEMMTSKGNTVVTANDELVGAIQERLKPVEAAALEMAAKNGVKDPAGMMEWYRAQIVEAAKK